MNTQPVKLVVLGSGTSQGVPMVACKCKVCTSPDPHDHRMNASIMLQTNGKNILIDCGKDFRYQAIRFDIMRVDHLFITHSHLDHIAGLDELRVYNMIQGGPIPVYGHPQHLRYLRDYTFHYLFDAEVQRGGGLASLDLIPIDGPLTVEGIDILPLQVKHGRLDIFGYKFLNCAYLSDVSAIPDETLNLLYGLDYLILDVLRYRPHSTHFNLAQGLALIHQLRPGKAYFTHICHDFLHQQVERELKDKYSEYYTDSDVHLLYDGLTLELAK